MAEEFALNIFLSIYYRHFQVATICLLCSAAFQYNPTATDPLTFAIDPSYEFSCWLKAKVGVKLQDSSRLCAVASKHEDNRSCAVIAGNSNICQVM